MEDDLLSFTRQPQAPSRLIQVKESEHQESDNRMDSSQVGLGVAFVAGLVSFLSPCMLPLVPIFLAQLVGQSTYQSTGQHENRPARFITFLRAVMFVLGFTLAFVALGATASVLGSFLRAHQFQLRQVGGILLILIGLHLAGILKVPFLYWQKRFALVWCWVQCLAWLPRQPHFDKGSCCCCSTRLEWGFHFCSSVSASTRSVES